MNSTQISINDPQVCVNYILILSALPSFSKENVETYVVEHLQKIGPPKCQLLHVEELRQAYCTTRSGSGYQKIEKEALEKLKPLVKACDEHVRLAKKGLEINFRTDESTPVYKDMLTEINQLSEEIATSLRKLEDHVHSLQLPQANSVILRIETLKRIKQTKEASLLETFQKGGNASVAGASRLTVCDVCGAYLSIHDYGIDRRLYDHTEGLMHKAFKQLRMAHKQLEETVRARDQQQPNPHTTEISSSISDKNLKRKSYETDINSNRDYSKRRAYESRPNGKQYPREKSKSSSYGDRSYKERDRYR
ncbi:hypothetical protein K493DRAFT_302850 [Basidiobolus meristosporus CBS 931.73]|uniref:LUC7-domain-containing protein n=1 Tax=Basidiobolus meristosporus CBS 931.73 TaxID=1314790 RepID=A0A1Y1Y5I4_9FUNG|nr:hypothetical protein K493DRAFT_302850 [Basidiobolus meristosporus CBS 931.73]|eukprot:ORX93155.1 hypothetical protein K493DRAFT_302850 [Basidiobolus meristosporus CBS 931.73]